MRIHLRTICPEIFGQFPGGWFDIEESISASSALLSCLEQYGDKSIKLDNPRNLIYMRNGKHISPDSILSENDQLMVLRPVYGG